ncbi:MAG TPA: hypothetical protein VFC93_06015 [Chloroflexota bacterium]|nr:hypothetical protein [Chloroflexota bacterium]
MGPHDRVPALAGVVERARRRRLARAGEPVVLAELVQPVEDVDEGDGVRLGPPLEDDPLEDLYREAVPLEAL